MEDVQKAIEESNPDGIYYLCGQSSVSNSFKDPHSTTQLIVIGALNFFEIIKKNINM